MPGRTRPGRGCRNCPAPAKSIFEGGPLKPTYTERKYVIDTGDYRITRAYDEEFSLPREMKKPLKLKKTKSKSSNSTVSLGFTNQLMQTWSGSTFMTEYEDFVINLEYERNTYMAEMGRKKWNEFKKKLKVNQIKRKATNAGPEWFQDLSPYQMELTDKLHLMLHGDIEEGHSVRTQEYLYKVGIAPEIPAKIVAKTVQEAGRNPIVFLFKIHERLVEIETEEYEKAFRESKKANKKISPYSINERILLSCVFHLHFPTLLEKLDKILPPPEKEPKLLWAKKPPRKKKYYSSPYLEPQPINEKPWYEERAEEELQKKVEAKIKKAKEKKEKEKFERKLDEQQKAAELEKEEKERKAKASLSQRKRRESLLEKIKNNKTLMEESVFAIDISDETIDKNFLLMRERKSMYFKGQGGNSDETITHQSLPVLTFEDLAAEPYEEEEVEAKEEDKELEYRNDPQLWVETDISNGCTQTPIRGVGRGCLYSPYVTDPDAPKEGVSEVTDLSLRRAPPGLIQDNWTQTPFTKEFKPLKKEMRDFLLKQRAVEKQMEKFYLTALNRRGVFGPPTDNICKTNCLKDLEDMAVHHEITVIKAESVEWDECISSDEELDMIKTLQTVHKVPRDISVKELLNVKRLPKKDIFTAPINERRMSGPPLPTVPIEPTEKVISTSKVQPEVVQQIDAQEFEEIPIEKSTDPFLNKPYTVECTDPQCELIDASELPMDELELARRRIAVLPVKRQLEAAITYLCDKGDPLGVLPNMELVPWLVRWFDKRRGVKRILTDEDKDELLKKSIQFWNSEYRHCTSAPGVEIPNGKYTWQNKKWLMNVLDKEHYRHRRAVKHLLIDNARDLFPTAFCEYFNTPLNKSFRQLFYTYFPACERDCFVFKPWDPLEDKKDDKKETRC